MAPSAGEPVTDEKCDRDACYNFRLLADFPHAMQKQNGDQREKQIADIEPPIPLDGRFVYVGIAL